MRLFIALFWVLFFPFIIFGQSIAPSEAATINIHLQEINPLWKDLYSDANEIQFNSENERIAFHLTKVIEYLNARTALDLNLSQINKRSQLIEYLRHYKSRRLFPFNDFLDTRINIFKDQHSTSCAVAYLLEQTGQAELVNQIQAHDNYDLLNDISNKYEKIEDWSDEYGVTLNELALIQPSYNPRHRDFTQWGNGGPIDGQINVMIADDDESILYLAGDFSMIDGQSAASIIAWDGVDWIDMGAGVNGEIVDIVINGNRIVIVGEFTLNDDPSATNIAYYENGAWHGLQYGDMEGKINTIETSGSRVYIGGDFQKVNGQNLAFIAYIAPSQFGNGENWSNAGTDYSTGQAVEIDNYLATNGPVRDIKTTDVGLIFGGNFSEVSHGVDTTKATSVATRNLAILSGGKWQEIEGPFDVIDKVQYLNNRLYVSEVIFENDVLYSRLHRLVINQWNSSSFVAVNEIEDTRVHGLVQDDNAIFAFGNITNDGPSLVPTSGFMMLENGNEYRNEGVFFNNIVRSAVPFQDHFYFAGDFTHPSGPYENIVKATRKAGGGSATNDLKTELKISTTLHNGNLTISHDLTLGVLSFSLFDFKGQLIDAFPLDRSGLTTRQMEIPSGKYVYQVQDKKRMSSGIILAY